MRTISLWQPYAQLVAIGAKQVETRHWKTDRRGPLAIHAAKRPPEWSEDEDTRRAIDNVLQAAGYLSSKDYRGSRIDPNPISREANRVELPRGCVVATCELVDCVEMQETDFMGIPAISIGAWDDRLWKIEGGRQSLRDEFRFGNFQPGRFAWILDKIQRIDPVPEKGRQGFWDWNPKELVR